VRRPSRTPTSSVRPTIACTRRPSSLTSGPQHAPDRSG